MCTLRLSLVGTVILALLTGPITVVGQSEASPAPVGPAGATIDITGFGAFAYGELQPDDSGVLHEVGRHFTMTWGSSDPRLSGEVTYDGNRDIFSGNVDVGLAVGTETYEIVNDGGRWLGQATGWAIPSGVGTDQAAGDVVLFRGEGGYDGWSAVVHIDWNQEPPVINAVIFPGEMPQAREPSPAG